MDNSYAPLEGTNGGALGHIRSRQENDRINTTTRYAVYSSLMLAIFIACAGFWGASRGTPLLYSLDAMRTVEDHAKTMTFVFTLIGTILAFTTGTLFNQLLKLSVQQSVAAHGLKIGLLEFYSRVYSRKWLHDHRSGRLLLSAFSIIFAIALGLLVSAYTGLITPTRVYLQDPVFASELDMSSDAFFNWFYANSTTAGLSVLQNCSTFKTFGTGPKALTLPLCPQVKDPLPFVSAGLASIESKYATYDPKTDVLGLSFNGTTKGVLPRGWNTIAYFDTFPARDLPPVPNYNYSLIQQGISANVSCTNLGLKSNITWANQGESLVVTTNGVDQEEIFLQNITFGPNKAAGIDYDSNLLLSGNNMVATFDYSYGNNLQYTTMELASYGPYAADWKLPNLTCTIQPYIVTANVSYNNATGLFAADVVSVPSKRLANPETSAQVNNWLFRITTILSGNQIINSIIALQNTPSYERGVFSNVTIDWPRAVELLLQGMTEYAGTLERAILEAEINSTHVQPSGFVPITGTVSSWRLGYNGESGSVVILFPLQAFVLLCAIAVIVMGVRTGIRHVTRFDPTNTTHIIIASALGGRNGGLIALNGENAIHADVKALNLKIEYKNDVQGFQEVQRAEGTVGYTELNRLGVSTTSHEEQSSKPRLFARTPFMRTQTG